MAIGHTEAIDGDVDLVLDVLREQRPPFSPEAAIAEFAALLTTYRVVVVVGDRYGGLFPVESFRRHGITYQVADRVKSELYRDALALIMRSRSRCSTIRVCSRRSRG